jgi:hypothetical protein
LVVQVGIGSVVFNRFDAVVASRLAFVHLAGADDLAVAGFQVEVKLVVGRLFALEAGVVS